jgi:hypothetical protein
MTRHDRRERDISAEPAVMAIEKNAARAAGSRSWLGSC